MGNGIIGNIGRYEANIVSEAIIKTYFNETGAKVAQNAIASALTFIGIDSLPTQGKISSSECCNYKWYRTRFKDDF